VGALRRISLRIRDGGDRHRCPSRPQGPNRSPRPHTLHRTDPTKRLQRFSVPGYWASGDRTENARNRDAGYVYAHCIVDDHSRLAYVELHATDTGQAAALTLRRAAAWMTDHGAGPTEAVMTDNARVYAAHVFQAELAAIGARHIRTPPYTPRWNGKVERF